MPDHDAKLRYGIPLALDASAVGLALLLHDGLSAYQAAARFTGRVSLSLFAVIAVLYAMPRRRDSARRLMAPFAAAHLVHFACLAMFLEQSGSWPAPARLAGGGLAYSMIVAMPLFQRFAAVESTRVSARARVVAEGVYLGWVGFIFLISYVLRITGKVPGAGGTRAEHLFLLGVATATACAHVALRLRTRTEAAAPTR